MVILIGVCPPYAIRLMADMAFEPADILYEPCREEKFTFLILHSMLTLEANPSP